MKRIAITMGEPGGVGPEVALRAVELTRGLCVPVLVGDPAVFSEASRGLGLSFRLREAEGPGLEESGIVHIIGTTAPEVFEKGRPTPGGGRASVAAIKKAVTLAVDGMVDAVVTAPVSKEAIRMAGYPWPGHTEMLAELTGTRKFRMMLVGGPLRVMLVTIHKALREVPGLITKERVLETIRLARRACSMLSFNRPKIAVASLNPHAGEGGLFGDEEAEAIGPAVRQAAAEGMKVTGPYPPDTLFIRAVRGEFDMVVCMYHDQGLIPLKLVAFDIGVNVTVGLPIIRTSPDHGTAYDIAWQGKADPRSMAEAIALASKLKTGL
jgi:4-hydroxythreonine-4-phosphate dehydrogenase